MKKFYTLLLVFFSFILPSKSQFFFNQVVGGSGLDEITDIANDSLGNIYSTGYFGSPTAQFGNFTLTNSSNFYTNDVFISKSTPNGNVLWSVKIGGPNPDKGKAIAVDKFGDGLSGWCWLNPSYKFPGYYR